MSRVEREGKSEQDPSDNRRDAVERTPSDRTPGKAEGEERTVDEALRENEETERS
jgi:hypothetical protein